MKIKKYSRWVLVLVILLASVKAIVFTGELILANYFLYSNNKEHAAAYIYHIISAKPIVYLSLQDNQETLVEDYIVKKAIYTQYRDHKNIFEILNTKKGTGKGLKELTIERFKTLYRDNVYLQYLFPPTPPQSNWENLDAVSLALLADKTLNPLTISLWEKARSTVDPEFTANLADYCRWQGNTELGDFLEKDVAPAAKPFLNPGTPARNESIKQLQKTLRKKNKLTNQLTSEKLKEYGAGSEDFNDRGAFKKKWEFSALSGSKDPRAASFTMGLDGTSENRCLRIMGFFTGSEDSKTKDSKMKSTARGGAMRKKILPVSKGYYLLSFDYLTATDRERPSFYLWKGISEVFLPPTGGRWKKAVYFLNNSSGAYPGIKPIFRMWGTGTVLIDNVYLAAITEPSFNFNRTALTYIAEWK